MNFKFLFFFSLLKIFPVTAMDLIVADKDCTEKAFIEAVMEGNLEKFESALTDKKRIDDTYEGTFEFPGYSAREKLTALQWAVIRSSGVEWKESLIRIIQSLLKNKADPISDLRWVDPCGDFTAYGYVMNLYKSGSERPSFGKTDYRLIPVNQC